MVETIKMTSKEERKRNIAGAHYNLFLVYSKNNN